MAHALQQVVRVQKARGLRLKPHDLRRKLAVIRLPAPKHLRQVAKLDAQCVLGARRAHAQLAAIMVRQLPKLQRMFAGWM